MAYVPDIIGYKPFYIQTNMDSIAIDTTQWGLVAKSNPYPLLPSPKELFANDWKDEHGDDEYTKEMYYESIEFNVSFYVKTFGTIEKTAAAALREQVNAFFAKICQGEFMIFDSYTGIGRRKVRYAGYEDENFVSRKDWSSAIFTIKFKVNDPVTSIVLKDGKLMEE